MKYKLVLTSMVLGAIAFSTSAVVGAVDIAPQVTDTAKHDAVKSNDGPHGYCCRCTDWRSVQIR